MIEYMGKKITRAQQSARIAYRKALAKAVRAAAKGSGWRSIEGCLFQECAGWFISVSPSVHIFEDMTTIRVSAKPMAIDPVFWDIWDFPGGRDEPLSFRFNGAWICRPPDFAEIEIAERSDIDMVAADILETANTQRDHVVTSWTSEIFLSLCMKELVDRDQYLPSAVSMLVAMGCDEEALDICESAVSRNKMGGFLSSNGTFSELARDWLGARIAVRRVN